MTKDTTLTRQPRRLPVPQEKHTEQFEVEAASGMIVRRIVRSNGQEVRTVMGSLGTCVTRVDMTDEDLRRLSDTNYLRERMPDSQIPRVLDRRAHVDDAEIRIADLFGGCGGMTLGAFEACRALGLRGRSVAAFEIDDLALGVFSHNFGGPQPKRDIGCVLAKRLTAPWTKQEQELKCEFGRVDMVVAGPPCQGHSNLNNLTRRADPKNELYFRVARFVRLFTPKWVIVENVPAVRHDEGKVVARTKRALEKLGYSVDEAIVRLADIGVAQARKRHVLVAIRSHGRGRVPKQLPAIDRIVDRFRVPERPVMWAISGLKYKAKKETFNSSAQPNPTTRRRIDWLFNHNAYELADSERPSCHRDKKHRYTAVYGRMRPNEPAPTITGGYDTMGRGRFVHPSERRTITPHEAARIQFFPDWFDFAHATRSRSGLAQIIGNAVPPKLAYVLALELMR